MTEAFDRDLILGGSDKQQHAIVACRCKGIHTVIAGAGVGKTHVVCKRLVPALLEGGQVILASSFTRRATANLSALEDLAQRYPQRLFITTTQALFFAAYRDSHPGQRWMRRVEAAIRLASQLSEPYANARHDASRALNALEACNPSANLPAQFTPETLKAYQDNKVSARLYDTSDVRQWLASSVEEVAEAQCRRGITIYICDEAPDNDPLERQFVEALAGRGVEVYLFGDPCQTLYKSLRDADGQWMRRLVERGEGHAHVLSVNRRSYDGPLHSANDFVEQWLSEYGGVVMEGVHPGGRGIDGDIYPDQARVLTALQQAVVAVEGLSMVAPPSLSITSRRDLAEKFGLPAHIEPGGTILVLTARDKDTEVIADALRETGREVVALRRGDDVRLQRALGIVLALVDPYGSAARSYSAQCSVADSACELLSLLPPPASEAKEAKKRRRRLLDNLARKTRGCATLAEFVARANDLFGEIAADGDQSAWVEAAQSFLSRWSDLEGVWRRRCDLASARNLIVYGQSLFHLPAFVSLRTVDEATAKSGTSGKSWWSNLVERGATSPEALGRAIMEAAVPSEDHTDLPGDRKHAAVIYVGTVHQLKGLEADHVVIACLDDGRFPYHGEDTAESRFVWYVALTRARKTLGYALTPGNDLYLPGADRRV